MKERKHRLDGRAVAKKLALQLRQAWPTVSFTRSEIKALASRRLQIRFCLDTPRTASGSCALPSRNHVGSGLVPFMAIQFMVGTITVILLSPDAVHDNRSCAPTADVSPSWIVHLSGSC